MDGELRKELKEKQPTNWGDVWEPVAKIDDIAIYQHRTQNYRFFRALMPPDKFNAGVNFSELQKAAGYDPAGYGEPFHTFSRRALDGKLIEIEWSCWASCD